MAFSSIDWTINQGNAWIYGIIFGYQPKALAEIKERHNWGDETVARLLRLRRQYKEEKAQAAMMTDDRPTIKEMLELVSFTQNEHGKWQIHSVHGDVAAEVLGSVRGNVCGDIHKDVYGSIGGFVCGSVHGDVDKDVNGSVHGKVFGKINGRNWQSIESPMEKLGRLIKESGDEEMLEAFNQLEDN